MRLRLPSLLMFLGLITGACDPQADRTCSDHNPEPCCDCHHGLRTAIPFEFDSTLITCADGYKNIVFPGMKYPSTCALNRDHGSK
jgi:hypothetical protein